MKKKTVFTVSTGDSGLMSECFTNIAALHRFLINDLDVSETDDIVHCGALGAVHKVKYTYNQLNKYMKIAMALNRLSVAQVESRLGGSIEINHININTK